MFGYLPAPCRCRIGDQVDLYRSTFCGLCNALAGQYGPPARMLINRDSTFVALLAAAQTQEMPGVTLSTRCQPWSRPMPVFETGPAPVFAAAVTLCGLQAKLDDERADEGGLRAAGCRLLSALSRTRFDRARAILAAGSFPVADVQRQLAGQCRVEAHVASGGDPAAAAQPSARAFGSILAHTARLAGNNANAAPLYRAGRSLGKLVYTLDAYQDLRDDGRRGRFNFLASQAGSLQAGSLGEVRRLAREIVSECQREIRQAWHEVELLRYRPVLEAVLLSGLSARTERILATGAGRWMATGDEDQSGEENRGRASLDTPWWNLCDCCYCPSDSDWRCCGECCRGCGSDGDCGSGDCGGCHCGACHNSSCDDNGCHNSGCPDSGCPDGGCHSGGCGGSDCSGCDCSGCDCHGCDGSGCDCGGCDCSS